LERLVLVRERGARLREIQPELDAAKVVKAGVGGPMSRAPVFANAVTA
jgi:hypothetical protein